MLGLLGACVGEPPVAIEAAGEGPLRVATTSWPVHWLALQLGQSEAQVALLLPADVDAATWEPGPVGLRKMAEAELILVNGGGYEPWLSGAELPQNRLVLTAKDCAPVLRHDGVADTRTWLDLDCFSQQAHQVTEGLARFRPENGELLRTRLAALQAELAALDQRQAQHWAAQAGATTLTAGPGYARLAARYGATLWVVPLVPGAAPDPASVIQVQQIVDSNPAPHVLLWPSAPGPAAIEALPAGIVHRVWDLQDGPVAGRDYDFVAQLGINTPAAPPPDR